MKAEVSTAVNFITTLLRGTGLLSEDQLQHFSLSLEEALGGEIKPDKKYFTFCLSYVVLCFFKTVCLFIYFPLKYGPVVFWLRDESQMNNES